MIPSFDFSYSLQDWIEKAKLEKCIRLFMFLFIPSNYNQVKDYGK